MSRRGRSEVDFGSDSFLDIIANIVGILIILIVIAGVRVSNAPVPVAEAPQEIPPEKEKVPPKPLPVQVAAPLPIPPLPVAALPKPAEPKPKPPMLADPKFVAQIADLEHDIAELESSQRAAMTAIKTLDDEQARLRRGMAGSAAELDTYRKQADASQARLTRLKSLLKRNQTELAGLRLQFDEANRRPKKSQVIRHKLTPVSQIVRGKEIHFRLFAGKIAHVPIEDLVKRMRTQVVRQKDWLVKFRRHQGEVGPINGFSMKFTVERRASSAIDELRNGGYGRISIVLSEWRIEPSRGLPAETEVEALSAGSEFVRKLRATDTNTTLTFWVYPDSFPLYRKLQQICHREGFTVAARPMPFGVPIAGSPKGTRSAGQ